MNDQPMVWHKSSFSGPNGQCVEVARRGDEALIRNSNRIAQGNLVISLAEMAAFVAGCKAGHFDDLL